MPARFCRFTSSVGDFAFIIFITLHTNCLNQFFSSRRVGEQQAQEKSYIANLNCSASRLSTLLFDGCWVFRLYSPVYIFELESGTLRVQYFRGHRLVKDSFWCERRTNRHSRHLPSARSPRDDSNSWLMVLEIGRPLFARRHFEFSPFAFLPYNHSHPRFNT